MLRFVAFLLLALSGASLAAESSPPAIESVLLVARDKLPDRNFRESVVLVAGGTAAPIGIILNKPTPARLSKTLKDPGRLKGNDGPLFFGGPVTPDEAVFLFRASGKPEDALEVSDGIYLSANHDVLERLLARERPLEGLRIFAGHAGWAPGQLEDEIRRGDWLLVATDPHALFDPRPEALWPALLRKAMATRVRYEVAP